MAIVLGANQYGKAETRVVRIRRDGDRHEIRDLCVSTSLRGDFSAAHVRGDQANVLPTDTQKNTCFAYAKEHWTGEIEDYGLALARHFASDIESVSRARVEVDEYRWDRISAAGSQHPHAFVRAGQEVRTAAVTVLGQGRAQRAWVVSGLKDLVVLKSTGSEFAGFLKDRYTTLEETTDRILATALTARWRYQAAGTVDAADADEADSAGGASGAGGVDEAGSVGGAGGAGGVGGAGGIAWGEAYAQIRQILLERFAQVHSRALQQTLWEMGSAVLAARADVAEIRLSAPNKHHFLADLAPFGLENPGEVFYAADRPYGLLQCTVQRDAAEAAGPAWDSAAAFG